MVSNKLNQTSFTDAPPDRGSSNTALLSAIRAAQNSKVAQLLSIGSDPNAKDHGDVSALHLAVFHGDASVIKTLLASGATVNNRDCHAQTPLFFAPNAAVCELLFQASADLHAVNGNGQSALHLAAIGGLCGTVKWLVDHMEVGMVNLLDKAGRTAYLLVKQRNMVSMTSLLKSLGADTLVPSLPRRSTSRASLLRAVAASKRPSKARRAIPATPLRVFSRTCSRRLLMDSGRGQGDGATVSLRSTVLVSQPASFANCDRLDLAKPIFASQLSRPGSASKSRPPSVLLHGKDDTTSMLTPTSATWSDGKRLSRPSSVSVPSRLVSTPYPGSTVSSRPLSAPFCRPTSAARCASTTSRVAFQPLLEPGGPDDDEEGPVGEDYGAEHELERPRNEWKQIHKVYSTADARGATVAWPTFGSRTIVKCDSKEETTHDALDTNSLACYSVGSSDIDASCQSFSSLRRVGSNAAEAVSKYIYSDVNLDKTNVTAHSLGSSDIDASVHSPSSARSVGTYAAADLAAVDAVAVAVDAHPADRSHSHSNMAAAH